MIQKYVDNPGDLRWVEAICSVENPKSFREHEVRDPNALLDKRARRQRLAVVLTAEDAHQNVCVSGAHVSRRDDLRSRPSVLSACDALPAGLRRTFDEYRRTCIFPSSARSPCCPSPPTPERCPGSS